MVQPDLADVQPRHAQLHPRPRRAQIADDLLKSLDFFDERTVVAHVASISNACRLAGWSFEETYFTFRTAYTMFFRAGRRRRGSEPQVRAYARNDWHRLARSSGQRVHGRQQRAAHQVEVASMIAVCDLTHASDEVLLGVVNAATVEQSSDVVVLSLDQLSERTGVGRDTVIAARERLVERGLLAVTRRGTSEDGRPLAHGYRLVEAALAAQRLPSRAAAAPDAPDSYRPMTYPLGGQAGGKVVHDAFTGAGSLGPRGRLLLDALVEGGWQRAALAARLNCHRNTLARLLAKAVAAGVAVIRDGLVHLSELLVDASTPEETEGILDCAAATLGVTGALQRVRDAIVKHRAWLNRRAWCIERDWKIFRMKLSRAVTARA